MLTLRRIELHKLSYLLLCLSKVLKQTGEDAQIEALFCCHGGPEGHQARNLGRQTGPHQNHVAGWHDNANVDLRETDSWLWGVQNDPEVVGTGKEQPTGVGVTLHDTQGRHGEGNHTSEELLKACDRH